MHSVEDLSRTHIDAMDMMQLLSSSLLALGSTSSIWREGPAEGISLTGTAVEAGDSACERGSYLTLPQAQVSLQSSVKNRSSQVRSVGYQALRTYLPKDG